MGLNWCLFSWGEFVNLIQIRISYGYIVFILAVHMHGIFDASMRFRVDGCMSVCFYYLLKNFTIRISTG